MKILFVTPQMTTGGAEKVIYDLTVGLMGRGHSVGVASSGGHLANELEGLGATIHHVPTLRGKGPDRVLRSAMTLSGILRSGGYQVVNSHAYMTAIETWLAGLVSGVRPPKVFTLHLQETQWMYPLMGRTAGFLARRTVTVCRSTLDRLAGSGLSRHQMRLIYNGVDVESFTMSRKGQAGDSLKVGVVARLVERKGHRFLLQAMARLSTDETCPTFTLEIVGDGPVRADLENLTRELGLSDSVTFLGDTKDVPSVLADLDIFVLPSTYEAFPVSLVEAMCSGVAIVATNVDGVPELVEDGVTGVLVPPANVDELAGAMKELLVNSDKRVSMAKAGVALVRDGFTIDHMVMGYEELFLSLADPDASAATR